MDLDLPRWFSCSVGVQPAEGSNMAAFFALLAFIFAALLGLAVTFYLQTRSNLKTSRQETLNIQQQANAALARYQSISDLEKYKADLTSSLTQLKHADTQWRQRISTQESTLNDLVARADAVEEALDMQSFGFYQPRYDFEDSERYSHQITTIRDAQKRMVKTENATHCPTDWTVDGSASKGLKMVREQAKLMLRAFNGECDAAIAKVKYNNVNNLEARITRSFDALNKLGKSKKLWLTLEYMKLKLQELFLVHEHREKVEEERQEQRRIKEQMREEERALREIEKAKRDAEQEEADKTKALDRARQELIDAHGQQTDRLQLIVDRLESELKDALERKARAIARAQLTRSGHVYVLSNIGSFGEGVFKIGMTRRLDPQDRVKELGDASVPFQFDVHAMIYCKDAPKLENILHRHFDTRRVNLVNLRREYFNVTLDEIRQAVEKHFGVITFVTVPKAEEFRRTLSMRDDAGMRDGGEVVAAGSV
jgi:multidrug efflux pump subunit AcrA (membrane-fusion protein)